MNHQAEHFEKLLKQERAKVAAMAQALNTARISMLDSGYRSDSVVIRLCDQALSATPAPAERVGQDAAVLAVQPAMNWRNCYHRASMDLCAIGELLGVPEEDQCTPEIIEAIKALQQSNPPEQVEPVAWMHDSPGRVDVISAEVKKLLVDSHDTAGHLHRPLDKSEHYTIPLYTALL